MSRIIAAFVILLTIAAAYMPTAQAALFHPKTHTLANGMQVVVIEDHRAPVVAHMVWYKVGAADEPAGKSGIAHFLEHLTFRTTAELAHDKSYSRSTISN